MTSPELFQMLLADARLPVAGHTQSAQLEPAVTDGLLSDDVPEFMALRLRTVARVEAGTAVVALHHLRQGMPLGDVELAWAARTPSAAMRKTSRTMAKALRRLLCRLWPDHPGLASIEGRDSSRAVVLAVAADACRLSPLALARVIGYDDVQTVASAALKLMPLDPADVVSWVVDSLPAVDALAAEAAPLTRPEDIPASGAPQIEAWAEAHALTTRRLFSA